MPHSTSPALPPGTEVPSLPDGPSASGRLGPRTLFASGVVVVSLGALGWALVHTEHAAAPERPPFTVQGDSITLQKDAPQWQYVELAVAKLGPALPPLPAPGRVDFDEKRTASVGTPLPGRVDRVLVRVGDRVKEHDRLFSVRSGALAELERDVDSAKEAVSAKRRLAERSRELVALKAAPEKDLQAAETELKEAELALRAAASKLASLSVTSEGDNLFWVTAPRAGTLAEMDLVASQEVAPDREKPLLRISDLSEVLVLADVQETDAPDLKVGAPVEIHTQGAAARAGVVEHISEVIDPKRRTVEIRIRARNEDRLLRPNAFVEVSLASDPDVTRVRVPAEAVVTEGSRAMIFVARDAGRLERVAVALGRQRDGEVELRSGLEPGSRFVSKGAILLLNQLDLVD